jgi:hypothetical protein
MSNRPKFPLLDNKIRIISETCNRLIRGHLTYFRLQVYANNVSDIAHSRHARDNFAPSCECHFEAYFYNPSVIYWAIRHRLSLAVLINTTLHLRKYCIGLAPDWRIISLRRATAPFTGSFDSSRAKEFYPSTVPEGLNDRQNGLDRQVDLGQVVRRSRESWMRLLTRIR